MNYGAVAVPQRTRNVVECELTMAVGRIDSFRKRAECLESDSECAKAHAWYSTRAAMLRRELESLTGACDR